MTKPPLTFGQRRLLVRVSARPVRKVDLLQLPGDGNTVASLLERGLVEVAAVERARMVGRHEVEGTETVDVVSITDAGRALLASVSKPPRARRRST